MTCKVCKFYKFEQNDMLGACKRYPTVVNKAPSDWCGEYIPCQYEPTTKDWEDASGIVAIKPVVESTVVYDINTNEVKQKGKQNARKQKRSGPLV